MCFRKRKMRLLAAAAGLLMLTSSVPAANITIFQFCGDPDFRSHPPEFTYDKATGLGTGTGSNGDGTFYAPGLIGVITGGLTGITSTPPGIGFSSPFNILSDLTMVLTGFGPDGPPTPVGAVAQAQQLHSGTFQIKYTPKDSLGNVIGPDLSVLTGSTTSALLTETNIGTSAGVLSAVVTYNGGLLYSKLAVAGLAPTGAFSFSMTGLTAHTLLDGGALNSFAADGVGTFDAAPLVPAPAPVWGGLVLTGISLIIRSRRPS